MLNQFSQRKKLAGALIAAFLVAASFTFLVSAQGSMNFALEWGALTGGGDRHTSEFYVIEDILGQAAVGNSDTATSQSPLRVVGGFLGPTNPNYSIFLPITIR
jgi:hypothetical protein